MTMTPPTHRSRRHPRDEPREQALRAVGQLGEEHAGEPEREPGQCHLAEQHEVDVDVPELGERGVVHAEAAHDEVADHRRGQARHERVVADASDRLHLEREHDAGDAARRTPRRTRRRARR